MKIKYVLLLACSFIIISCATVKPFKGISDLHGYVYDFYEKPVGGCEIYIDSEHRATTDSYGRFVVKNLKYGSYRLETKVLDYEAYSGDVLFVDQTHIVFIKILDIESIYSAIEDALIQKEYTKTDELIFRALKTNPQDINALMYLAVLRFYEGNIENALYALNATKEYNIYDESMLEFEKLLKGILHE